MFLIINTQDAQFAHLTLIYCVAEHEETNFCPEGSSSMTVGIYPRGSYVLNSLLATVDPRSESSIK